MEKTLKTIENVLGRINTHPDYSKSLRQKFLTYLRAEAEKHSIGLEISEEKGSDSKGIDKEREIAIRQIEKAKNFLYLNGITLYSLSKLGSTIEPEKNKNGSFRLEDVQFGSFIAPEFQNVPQGIEDLIYQLNEVELNPIVRATNAHLSLVQIHPYKDGNGRAARLLQNFCLEQRGFPPIIIQKEEGELYRNLIEAALNERYAKRSNVFSPTEEEKRFNLYLATKVLESAKSLEEELSFNKRYSILLSGIRDRGILRTVTNSLRSETKRITSEGSTFSEKRNRGREYEIAYQGPLESQVMETALEKFASKYGFKYEIKHA